jgi:aminoglycoside 6'-N-acetyltransferase
VARASAVSNPARGNGEQRHGHEAVAGVSLHDAAARLRFRPLTRPDLRLLVRWIARPHVKRWFPEPATLAAVEREYGGELRGDERIRVFIVELDGVPVAMIQCYRVEDFLDDPEWSTADWDAADCVGIDYMIGEQQLTGRGLGTALIGAFIDTVLRELHPQALGVVADPEPANAASIGALRRLGFREHRLVQEGGYGRPVKIMRRDL